MSQLFPELLMWAHTIMSAYSHPLIIVLLRLASLVWHLTASQQFLILFSRKYTALLYGPLPRGLSRQIDPSKIMRQFHLQCIY
jgi:hypothetical protein